MEVTLVHTWPLPAWLTVAFIGVVAAYVLAIYLREPGAARRPLRVLMTMMRVSLIILVIVMMYGWMRNRYRTDLPDLVVAVDDSESMSLADSYGAKQLPAWLPLPQGGRETPKRIDLARRFLLRDKAETLRYLAENYHVKLYWIGESARIESGGVDQWTAKLRKLEATGTASRLGRNLRSILQAQRGRPTAAIIMLTDGVTTEGKTISEAAAGAHRRGIPLYLIGLGDERPPRDVRVTDVLVDDVVFLGDLVHFDASVAGTGFGAQQVQVRLRRADTNKILAKQTVNLAGDSRPQRVRLSYRPEKKGDFRFVVEVEPLEGEANLDNNRVQRIVHVRDETIRVLLVQEYPSYEFRYLKTLLQRGLKRSGHGKAIELTTVLQEADAGYVGQDETARRAFPVNRDALFAYDVVIFGDVNPSYLSRPVMENLVAFVMERGGGLVLIAGPRYMPLAYRNTPLETLFPGNLDTVTLPTAKQLLEQSYRVRPTRLGMTSPMMQIADSVSASAKIWSQLPPIRWFAAIPDLRPSARVLAECNGTRGGSRRTWPIICEQFVGAGRVLFHATDETYLWARYEGSDQYYERYWRQAIRSLSRSKLLDSNRKVELVLERERYYRGETVRMRVQFLDERVAPAADDGVTVIVERDSGRRRRITLHRDALRRGVFETSVTHLPDGSYRAWVSVPILPGKPPARRFTVLPPPGERARLEMDATDLKRAAKVSRGKFYTIQTARRLRSDLPRGRQVRIETLPSTPVWNSPWLAGLFVILLVSEWLLRRRLGWL